MVANGVALQLGVKVNTKLASKKTINYHYIGMGLWVSQEMVFFFKDSVLTCGKWIYVCNMYTLVIRAASAQLHSGANQGSVRVDQPPHPAFFFSPRQPTHLQYTHSPGFAPIQMDCTPLD